MDETMVSTTLQQPRASRHKNALVQIKIQVKGQKVNPLLDNGSQCDLISETLVDEIGFRNFWCITAMFIGMGKIEMWNENHKDV